MGLVAGLGVAWASQGVVVQVVDESQLLAGSPQVELIDEAGTLHGAATRDDGEPPDAQSQDGTWSGVLDQVHGTEVVLAVTDDEGRRWTGPFSLAPERPTLRVMPTAEGDLLAWRRAPGQAPLGGGVPPDPTWTDPAGGRRAPFPFGLLVWGAGLGLGALALFWWADPGAAGGGGGQLTRVILPTPQARGRFLAERAGQGPLVIAGPVPPGAGAALALGPGRVDVEDLLRAVRDLPGRPQVAITGELEGPGGAHGEAALVVLADRLPASVDAFVLTLRPA